jgi:hypothetical protein
VQTGSGKKQVSEGNQTRESRRKNRNKRIVDEGRGGNEVTDRSDTSGGYPHIGVAILGLTRNVIGVRLSSFAANTVSHPKISVSKPSYLALMVS